MRTKKKYEVTDAAKFKGQLFQWAEEFEEVVWLDSNNHRGKDSEYEAVLAVEAFTALQTDVEDAFDKLHEYQQTTADWIFGYLSYDLKNDTEALVSENPDGLDFPDLYFFQPKKLFLLKEGEVELQYLRLVDDEMDADMENILELNANPMAAAGDTGQIRRAGAEHTDTTNAAPATGPIAARVSREEYLAKVEKILEHIHRGDIYEANFCQEFFMENAMLRPSAVYEALNAVSHPPFAAFLRVQEHFLLSASPERYLKKKGRRIISQPIKGTAARSGDREEDLRLKEGLRQDPKERSENIMIVDLVRNDLSRTARKGSVAVEELCAIRSFRQVHQMISTVTSELEEGVSPVEVLRTSFPMGSMTGAPKISAMKIIETLEESRRGLYSGAVGYFSPLGDFDFNVVIRSILYNRERGYASFSVGGAITAGSVPGKEYEECLLKARAMREVLERAMLGHA